MLPPSVTGELYCFPRYIVLSFIFSFGRRVIHITFDRYLRVHSEIDSDRAVCPSVSVCTSVDGLDQSQIVSCGTLFVSCGTIFKRITEFVYLKSLMLLINDDKYHNVFVSMSSTN